MPKYFTFDTNIKTTAKNERIRLFITGPAGKPAEF